MSAGKILLIEDDPDISLGFKIRLEVTGYQVIQKLTATEGLESVSKDKPDLVILDLNLPDMHGFDVLKLLQAQPETVNIPVIIMTAQGTTENFTKGLSAENVVTFLEKPVSNDELIATLQVALRTK